MKPKGQDYILQNPCCVIVTISIRVALCSSYRMVYHGLVCNLKDISRLEALVSTCTFFKDEIRASVLKLSNVLQCQRYILYCSTPHNIHSPPNETTTLSRKLVLQTETNSWNYFPGTLSHTICDMS